MEELQGTQETKVVKEAMDERFEIMGKGRKIIVIREKDTENKSSIGE